MKNYPLYILLILLITSACASNQKNQIFKQGEVIANQTISLHNPLNKDRVLVPVEINLSDLKEDMQLGANTSLLVSQNNTIISSQLDDLDNDGKADQLVCQVRIGANSDSELTIFRIGKSVAEKFQFKKGTHAQLGFKNGKNPFIIKDSIFSEKGDLYKETMHHGPALESDQMAYRMYFDDRSSIDIYGKIHSRLELDTTKWYSNDGFIANEYGGDILFVSNTIGVGSLRTWNGKEAQIIKTTKGRYAVVRSSGPVRSVIDMCAKGVNGENELLSRMIIYAGHREMIYRSFINGELNMDFCTGVRKMDGAELKINKKAGYISLWGTDFPRIDHEKYPKVTVGLGVLVPKQYQTDLLAEDEFNHLIGVTPRDNFMEYHVVAAWNQQKNGIASADEMELFLRDLSLDVNHPIAIEY